MILPTLQLPCDYDVIACAEVDPGEFVALVALPSNKVTPYATYRVEQDGMCFCGDYLHTRDRAEAVRRFMVRAGLAL